MRFSLFFSYCLPLTCFKLFIFNFISFELYFFWTLFLLNFLLNFISIELYFFWTLFLLNYISFELYFFWTLFLLNFISFKLYIFWTLFLLNFISFELYFFVSKLNKLYVFTKTPLPLIGVTHDCKKVICDTPLH